MWLPPGVRALLAPDTESIDGHATIYGQRYGESFAERAKVLARTPGMVWRCGV
jgi:hypothetical protein